MTLHIFDDLIQGTDEWHDQRRGIVTASVVGRLLSVTTLSAIDYQCPACNAPSSDACRSKRGAAPIKTLHPERTAFAVLNRDQSPLVIAPSTGDDARNLTAQLVAERITGWTDPTYVNSDMLRGHEHEPFARDIYSEHYAPVTTVGFMRLEESWGTLGFSPDGLVDDDGAIEIKAPRAKTHIQTVLADEVPAQYMPQLQGALLASGRKWIDFVSFTAGLPLWVKRVEPDERWFEAITEAVAQFERTAADVVARYQAAIVGLPETERINDLGLVF